MPKHPTAARNGAAALADATDASDVAPREPLTPIEAFWRKADALYRTAKESCRQHERLSHLVHVGALEMEQRATQQTVLVVDELLEEVTAAYERCCAKGHPPKEDEGWQRANALWLASREYARRVRTSVRAAKNMNHGDAARFGELALDYDLEASALLAVKQAGEAYKKVRPEA